MAIKKVSSTDTIATGRTKWNDNDAELSSRIDSLEAVGGITSFARFNGADGVSDAVGIKFFLTLNTGESLRNGSVVVIINGVYYLSATNQRSTISGVDFFIGDDYVLIKNLRNGGSISIAKYDSIGVYFQRDFNSGG